jgi:hypothetical protein
LIIESFVLYKVVLCYVGIHCLFMFWSSYLIGLCLIWRVYLKMSLLLLSNPCDSLFFVFWFWDTLSVFSLSWCYFFCVNTLFLYYIFFSSILLISCGDNTCFFKSYPNNGSCFFPNWRLLWLIVVLSPI